MDQRKLEACAVKVRSRSRSDHVKKRHKSNVIQEIKSLLCHARDSGKACSGKTLFVHFQVDTSLGSQAYGHPPRPEATTFIY